ncbi:protein FAR1-RELATED SEQUENCE 5-like [Silene latifolia]|uniref:protein FAR1-RELATED SEQUENCE 5-like n=1 Tax=Silene latifolia TaxID=37657 RepID=UPI003D77D4C0
MINDNDDTIPALHNNDIVSSYVDEDANPGSIILTDGSIFCLKEDFDASGSLVGLKATKWEYLLTLYNRHAPATGFGTRKGTRRIEKNVEYERYLFCNCQGEHANGRALNSVGTPSSSGTQTKKVNITRSVCKASIRTQVNSEGLWKILNNILDHNHSLTPPQWQHNHMSERKITAEEGEVIEMMTEALVRPSVQYRVLAAISGGEEFVGHTKRDHINYVNRLKMRAIEGGDASTLVELLTKCQSEDPGFFYHLKFGADERLCHVFWRDSMMKKDYLLYHDVLIFDTTYRTNKYNLICGLLIGINNHWFNIMFGFAFISNKQDESFEWLFNAFKESMGEDVLPVTIFTDQDLAVTNAIKESVFNKCLNGCYSEAEFEDTWRKMISDYGLHDSDWFECLYTLREKWCTALNKEYFSAGILSSQRSESNNHALGFQATKTTSLTEFFHIFESTVRRWRSEEERNEFNNIRAKPTSVFPMVDLLDHAAQVYTLNLFRAFEKEFGIAIGTGAIECTTEDHIKSYLVYPSGSDENPHHVTFGSSNLLIDCTCRKFQESGMLCFHSIRILHLRSVSEIPDRYISRRWTKFAKKEVWDILLPNDRRRSGINEAVNWRRQSLTMFNNLITKCQSVSEARSLLYHAYSRALEEVQSFFNYRRASQCPTNSVPRTGPTILDPNEQLRRGVNKGRKAGYKNKSQTVPLKQMRSNCHTLPFLGSYKKNMLLLSVSWNNAFLF